MNISYENSFREQMFILTVLTLFYLSELLNILKLKLFCAYNLLLNFKFLQYFTCNILFDSGGALQHPGHVYFRAFSSRSYKITKIKVAHKI
jgi:hypothetical protein